ncbi:MAG: hypothetical protein ACXWV9_06250 [Flavisolibacter sp.]
MKRNKPKDQTPEQGRLEHPLAKEISQNDKQIASNALAQADEDMENDPENSSSSPNDDLDEGELARLGEDKTDIV